MASRRKSGYLVVPVALAAISTATLTTLFSTAFFTDTKSVTGNSFTTGTVALSATPATAAVSLANMSPGDTKVGKITVTNTGSLAERYSMLSTADNTDGKGLAAALVMTVKSGVTTCDAANFNASGTVVYGPAPLGTTGGTKVIGDAAVGSQAGDRVLAAGATEDLCAQVNLPTSAANPLQNATTTAVFRFDSEQTTNNP